MPLAEGSTAPAFILPDQNGKEHSLEDYKGKWVLVYFYPKDDTPGCTAEACAIRDNFPQFSGLDADVLGVSADSVESHRKFAEKYELPFTLLSDESKEVYEAYDVQGRQSFLINPDGDIARVYENVKPDVHATEVLADLAQLQE